MRYLLPLLLLLPLNAYADPILYQINFTLTSFLPPTVPPPAPTGSFTYDADTPAISLLSISHPQTGTFMVNPLFQQYPPLQPPVCLGGKTGAVAAFALLNGDCGGHWAFDGANAAAQFRIDTPAGSMLAYVAPNTPRAMGGTWTISVVPESPWLIAAGLCQFIVFMRKKKGRVR